VAVVASGLTAEVVKWTTKCALSNCWSRPRGTVRARPGAAAQRATAAVGASVAMPRRKRAEIPIRLSSSSGRARLSLERVNRYNR
jgi:hypothetical protein